jgi:hypothetical protein
MAESKYVNVIELEKWKKRHEPHCNINFNGIAKAMEKEAAVRLWNRSLGRNLRYTCMLSEGDSVAYKAVCQERPYGDGIHIEKMECINHCQKRMGTALRKLCTRLLHDRRRAGEQMIGETVEENDTARIIGSSCGRPRGTSHGQLTREKCELLQRYYHLAITKNTHDIEAMRNAIWATLLHSQLTDDTPQHHLRPTGEDSWCFYNAALQSVNTTEPKSHSAEVRRTALSATVAEALIPLYERMSVPNLLKRLTLGKRQNANESLHSLIWAFCPKEVFVGLPRVESSVAKAVGQFNEGSAMLTRTMRTLGVVPTLITEMALNERDTKRLRQAETKTTDRMIQKRKQQNEALRKKMRQADEDCTYGAGIAD